MAGISIQKAQRIIAAGFEKARAEGFRPMAVIVLDAGGHPVAFGREDGASPGRFGMAQGKAYGTAMLGLGGRRQAELAEVFPALMGAANGVFSGAFVPAPGGVVVKSPEGEILGAVGVSGGMPEEDAAVAIAGIEAVDLVADA